LTFLVREKYEKMQYINGANTSFACYDLNSEKGNNRIQLKASSISNDLTSFGPNSIWDRIFFIDFYKEGKWDKSFDIYELNTIDIKNFPVNKNQTLQEQQIQGRRPRFKIKKDLISNDKYISKETYKIENKKIVKL